MSKSKSANKNIKKNKNFSSNPNKKDTNWKYSRLVFWGSFLAVIILGVLIYSNTIHVPFYYDDFDTIIDNPYIKSLHTFSSLPSLFDYSGRYLSFLSFALNYNYGQLDVTWYHIINLIIHLINSVLVMLLTHITLNTATVKDKYSIKEKSMFVLFTGLIFVAHPLQTQAVTYITQRMTSLAALFYLSALILYMKARTISVNKNHSISKRILIESPLFILCGISFILGIWSKQIVASLPIAFILLEILFIRNSENKINWKLVTAISVVFFSFVVIFIFKVGLPIEADNVSRETYLLTQINVLVTYIRLLFLPINLNLDYDFPLTTSLFDITTIIDLIILAAIIYAGIKIFKKQPLISFAIFWFFITLSVESSIIPIRDVIVEHRLYLPIFGFSLAIISLLFLVVKHDKLKYSILAAVLLFYSISTYNRNQLWNNPEKMWTDVISKSPNKDRPYLARGTYYLDTNQNDLAITDFMKTISLKPDDYKAYDNLGLAYQNKNDFKTALKYHDAAIKIKPDFYIAYNNRGACYIYLQEWDKAIQDFKSAVGIYSNYADAYFNLGYSYYHEKDYKSSLNYFLTALKLKPSLTQTHKFLVMCYAYLNQKDLALKQLDTMRRLGLEIPKPVLDFVNKK